MIIKEFFSKFKDNSRTNCTFLEFKEFSRTKVIFKDFSRSVRTLTSDWTIGGANYAVAVVTDSIPL